MYGWQKDYHHEMVITRKSYSEYMDGRYNLEKITASTGHIENKGLHTQHLIDLILFS